MSRFYRTDEIVLFFLAVAAFLTVIEVCFRLGRRHPLRSHDATKSHMGALQAALLLLLALLLGFNFAQAASRFDARKTLIQEEVNSIRTTWLRVQLLPAPYRAEFSDLLEQYVSARIDFMQAGSDDSMLEKANVEAWGIERQLWTRTNAMVAQDSGGAPTSLFIQSLNDMINVNEKRHAALDNHVPEPVIHLLFTVALGALGFIGYGYGLTGQRRHASTAIFAILIAMVLTTILDLDRPRSGIIRVGEESMLRLRSDIEGDAS